MAYLQATPRGRSSWRSGDASTVRNAVGLALALVALAVGLWNASAELGRLGHTWAGAVMCALLLASALTLSSPRPSTAPESRVRRMGRCWNHVSRIAFGFLTVFWAWLLYRMYWP